MNTINSQIDHTTCTITNPIMKFFVYDHLPEKLQKISKPIKEFAEIMNNALPKSPEKAVGLRKLLEAKDCFIRSAI